MANPQELIDICKGHKVYIQTHNFPDPDAIASAFGMKKLLENFDIEAQLVYDGSIEKLNTKKMTEIFNIDIKDYESVKDGLTEEDYIVCVDSQKNGGNITDFIGEEIAAIDHHPTYKEEKYRYMDVQMVGSCSTIIADYFRKLNVQMDTVTASALMYGLKMDTLQLSRGVKDLDIDIFSYLFNLSDDTLITKLEKNTMEYRDLKAYAAAIENIKIYGKIGFACIPFTCPDALIAIISDFILQLDEVDVAVVYSIRDDGIKFSVRSEDPNVDAGDIVGKALKDWGNGGGHPTMAGGLIRKENMDKLGPFPEAVINQIFLHVLGEDKPKF